MVSLILSNHRDNWNDNSIYIYIHTYITVSIINQSIILNFHDTWQKDPGWIIAQMAARERTQEVVKIGGKDGG